jgi:capsular exopolysaccharide synthesis family protein
MNLTIATVVGLALGLGSAVIRDRLDRRLRGTGDLSQHAGMSVLAMIPSFGRRRSGHPVTMQPGSAAAEAFRYLRARVQQALLRQGRGTLLVTSAKPGEGRTTTAVNLALAFAASGSRVVLMEADLRGERLATQFGLPEDTVGLTTLLTERVPIASALQETDVPGLRLLTQGPPVPAPGDLLAGHWLPRLMAGLLGTAADLVIIDAPPILSKADAVSLLRVSDATLLVVDGQRTSRRLVADAAHEIGWAGGMAVAAVVNTVPRRVRRRPIPLWRPFTTSLKSAGPAADGEIETIPAPHE